MTRREKRILIAKLIHISVNGLTCIGLFSILGSLGALEVGRISLSQFLVQIILGLGITVFSRYAHYKIYEEDRTYDER